MSIAAPRPGGRLRRLLQVTGVFLAVVILVWLVLSIVWGGQRLGPQRDFVQEFNATIETIPMTQRAWPRLRTAVDELDLDQNRSFATQVDDGRANRGEDLHRLGRGIEQPQPAPLVHPGLGGIHLVLHPSRDLRGGGALRPLLRFF